MMRFGLNEETIRAISGVFRAHPAVRRAVLYGSRAKGNFKQESDIDLTLEGDEIGIDELAKIDSELDDLLLPYQFDISVLRQVTHSGLLEHIRRVGLTFYQRDI